MTHIIRSVVLEVVCILPYAYPIHSVDRSFEGLVLAFLVKLTSLPLIDSQLGINHIEAPFCNSNVFRNLRKARP